MVCAFKMYKAYNCYKNVSLNMIKLRQQNIHCNLINIFDKSSFTKNVTKQLTKSDKFKVLTCLSHAAAYYCSIQGPNEDREM